MSWIASLSHAHMRHCCRGDVDVAHQRTNYVARAGALHGDDGPLFGDRCEPHAKFREFGLTVVLHVVQHTCCAAGGRGDVEAIRREAGDDAVVHHEACLVQHHAVAAATDGKAREVAGVDPVEEFSSVGADHFDLAEGRGVEDADRGADGAAFACNGAVHVLGGVREVVGALPGADVLEYRAPRSGPSVHRGLADGFEQHASRVAGEGTEGHGRIRHAECRVADIRNRSLQYIGDDTQGVHVRRLALVGCHAGGGVALDVLDRAEAFARCRPQVLRGDIVLEIDERRAAGGVGRREDSGGVGLGDWPAVAHHRRRGLPPGTPPVRTCRCRRRRNECSVSIRLAGTQPVARRSAACCGTASRDAPTASSRRSSAVRRRRFVRRSTASRDLRADDRWC